MSVVKPKPNQLLANQTTQLISNHSKTKTKVHCTHCNCLITFDSQLKTTLTTFSRSCVFCAPLDRYISRHMDRHSTNVSADISTNTRPICRSTYRPTLGQYNDRDMLVDVSTDVLTEISAESRSTHPPTISRYLGRYSSRRSADPPTSDCQRNIDRLSVIYRSKAQTVTVRCISYMHFPMILFWSSSKISKALRSDHVPQIQALSSSTLKSNYVCKLQSLKRKQQ